MPFFQGDASTVVAESESQLTPPPLCTNSLSSSSSRDPTKQWLIHRRYTNITDTIKKNLRNLSAEEQASVVFNALKTSDSYHLSTKLEVKPRGISSVTDDTLILFGSPGVTMQHYPMQKQIVHRQ